MLPVLSISIDRMRLQTVYSNHFLLLVRGQFGGPAKSMSILSPFWRAVPKGRYVLCYARILGALFLSALRIIWHNFLRVIWHNRPISPSASRPAKLVGDRSFLSSIQPTVPFRQTLKNSHIQIR